MRLTEFEKKTIKETAKSIFGSDTRVFLFGSRVDDNQKGGDIDIYIETNLDTSLQDKIHFLSLLKTEIGDQKIDVVINSPNKPVKDIFKIAKDNGIQI